MAKKKNAQDATRKSVKDLRAEVRALAKRVKALEAHPISRLKRIPMSEFDKIPDPDYGL